MSKDQLVALGNVTSQPVAVESLRATMRTAPFYETDGDATSEWLPTHEYAVFPATEQMPGRVITEIHEPDQKLYDGANEQFNTSRTTWRYQEANAMNGWMGQPIGAAFLALGFTSKVIETDHKGSRIIDITYPSAAQLTARLSELGLSTLNFVSGGDDASTEQVMTALMQGNVLIPENPDRQATKTIMNVNVWGLLPKELTDILQAKAAHVLDPLSPAINWAVSERGPIVKSPHSAEKGTDEPAVTNELATQSFRDGNTRMFAQELGTIGLLILAPDIDKAIGEPVRYTPTPVDELGYRLARLVETDQAKLPDRGLALATACVERVHALQAAH